MVDNKTGYAVLAPYVISILVLNKNYLHLKDASDLPRFKKVKADTTK